jgi:uncharacterized phage protein gp47/JayE
MPLSVEQLYVGQTEEQIKAFLLDALASLGFKTTSWHEGSVQRNLIEACAKLGKLSDDAVKGILNQVLVNPRGPWLDLRGSFFLQIDRIPAVKAQRRVSLTNGASSPPYVITTKTAIVANGLRFFPESDLGTLGSGATATVIVNAEFGGVGGNTPTTPKVPGMGGIVAAWVDDPIVPGVDTESDDRYAMRQDRRLAELTYSVSLRAYELWALTAAPSVKRVRAINNYPVENAIRVVLDPGTGPEIALVQAALLGRNPPNDSVTVTAANAVPYAINVAPRVRAGVTATRIQQYLDKVILYDMPIGGWVIAAGVAGRLLREKLAEVLLCQGGAYSAGIVSPSTDLVLGATDIIDPTYTINPEVIP